MYLLIYPSTSCCAEKGEYKHEITDDMHRVTLCLEKQGTTVYKLDRLTEVTNIEITYDETTKETEDD